MQASVDSVDHPRPPACLALISTGEWEPCGQSTGPCALGLCNMAVDGCLRGAWSWSRPALEGMTS